MKKNVIVAISIFLIIVIYCLGHSIVSSQKGIHNYFHKTFISIDDAGYIINPLENKITEKINVFIEGELNQLKNEFKGKADIEGYSIDGNTDLKYATYGKEIIYYIGLNYNENVTFSDYRYLIVIDGQDLMFIIHTPENTKKATIVIYTKDTDHILDIYNRLFEIYKAHTLTME